MSGMTGLLLKAIGGDAPNLLKVLNGLEQAGEPHGLSGKGWFGFCLILERPLDKYDEPNADMLYEYRFEARKKASHYIILSSSGRAVSYLVNVILPDHNLRLRPQGIDVDSFVRNVIEEPGFYSFSYLQARVTNSGAALNTIAMHGEDIGASDLLLNNLKNLNFYSCGIAMGASGVEIVRLGTKGSLYVQSILSIEYMQIEEVIRKLSVQDLFVS